MAVATKTPPADPRALAIALWAAEAESEKGKDRDLHQALADAEAVLAADEHSKKQKAVADAKAAIKERSFLRGKRLRERLDEVRRQTPRDLAQAIEACEVEMKTIEDAISRTYVTIDAIAGRPMLERRRAELQEALGRLTKLVPVPDYHGQLEVIIREYRLTLPTTVG